MALCNSNIRLRIDYTATLKSGKAFVFPYDQSFIVTWVAVPLTRCQPGEVLRVLVNEELKFCYPAADLIDRYGRFIRTSPPRSLTLIGECIEDLGRAIRDAQTQGASPSDITQHANALSLLLKGFAEAASAYQAWYGIKLERSILVPPRATLVAELSHGTECDIYLRGLLDWNVA
jgi:hypothetical protein